jgi:hypothetical protein
VEVRVFEREEGVVAGAKVGVTRVGGVGTGKCGYVHCIVLLSRKCTDMMRCRARDAMTPLVESRLSLSFELAVSGCVNHGPHNPISLIQYSDSTPSSVASL